MTCLTVAQGPLSVWYDWVIPLKLNACICQSALAPGASQELGRWKMKAIDAVRNKNVAFLIVPKVISK
jgi:hypothetical protein